MAVAMFRTAVSRHVLVTSRTFATSTLALKQQALSSPWSNVQQAPPDAILGLTEAFKKDTFAEKVNLGVGAYRDENGNPYVLPSVAQAEENILKAKNNKEYAPIVGEGLYGTLAAKLIFGEDADLSNITSIQTISGTGALCIGAHFLNRHFPFPTSNKEIYLPNPSWGNHTPIFRDGGIEAKQYRYYDKSTFGLDFDGMMSDIGNVPDGSAVLLHACAHNPTGVDPSKAQWKELSALFKKKNLFPFFDSAYQGFASGDFENDAFAIRQFRDDGHILLVCQSFAKNMGLYGERAGAIHLLCQDGEEAARAASQAKIIIRPMYSSPPIHGAQLVTEVLKSPELSKQFYTETAAMASRMNGMRSLLVKGLEAEGSVRNWDHITDQIGMFCFTGLTPGQVKQMIDECHIYLTGDGRVSIAGVTPSNVGYISSCIHKVTK